VVDQGSKDGVWISGRKIARQKLEFGDQIELGKGGPKIKIEFAAADALPPLPTAGIPATAAPLPAAGKTPNMAATWAALVVVAIVLIGVAGYFVMANARGTEDAQLIEAARKLEPSVGLVVIVDRDGVGRGRSHFCHEWPRRHAGEGAAREGRHGVHHHG